MATVARTTGGGRARAMTIAAIIVVAALAVAVVTSIRNTPSAPPSDVGMPPAQTVPTDVARLHRLAEGRISAWSMQRALTGPNDVLVGADGQIWVTEQNQATVDRFDPSSGTLTRYLAPKVWQDLGAFELTQTPDGAVWFSGYPGGAVGRILPDGTMNAFPNLLAIAGGIATGPDGSVWVGASQDGKLLRISPDGGLTVTSVAATNGQPAFIRSLAGSGAAVWFSMPSNDAIGMATGDGQVQTFDVPAGANPYALVGDGAGGVWATMNGAAQVAHVGSDGQVEMIDVPATGRLGDIAMAPDGTLWVTQLDSTILHLGRDGALIERVPLPKPAPTAAGISVAADGTVWAVSNDGNMIVRIAASG